MTSKLESKRDKLDEKRDRIVEKLDKIERSIIDRGIKPSKNISKIKMELEDMKDDLDDKIEELDRVMSGKGVLRVIQKGINLVTSGKVNPEWDYRLKSGETHAPVVGPDNKLYRDRFSGPGTHLSENIQEILDKYGGIQAFQKSNASKWSPNPDISLIALMHDISYALTAEMEPGPERDAFVKKADERFLKNMEKVSGKSGFLPKTLISAKMDLLGPDAFASKFKSKRAIPRSEKDMYTRIQSVLAHQGYGKRGTKRRPKRGSGDHAEKRGSGDHAEDEMEEYEEDNLDGSGKKNSWIEHVKATAKKEGVSYGKAISLASKTWKK